jgi:hypothetical protein
MSKGDVNLNFSSEFCRPCPLLVDHVKVNFRRFLSKTLSSIIVNVVRLLQRDSTEALSRCHDLKSRCKSEIPLRILQTLSLLVDHVKVNLRRFCRRQCHRWLSMQFSLFEQTQLSLWVVAMISKGDVNLKFFSGFRRLCHLSPIMLRSTCEDFCRRHCRRWLSV